MRIIRIRVILDVIMAERAYNLGFALDLLRFHIFLVLDGYLTEYLGLLLTIAEPRFVQMGLDETEAGLRRENAFVYILAVLGLHVDERRGYVLVSRERGMGL